jgi:hypothetical protein
LLIFYLYSGNVSLFSPFCISSLIPTISVHSGAGETDKVLKSGKSRELFSEMPKSVYPEKAPVSDYRRWRESI